MKILLISLLLLIGTAASTAQNAQIFAAFGQANANALEKFLDERVEVVIENRPAFMTRQQAISTLDAFFKRIDVRSCQELHQGSSRNRDSKYTIGQLVTGQGEYRVFLFIRQVGNRSVIQEIRIDKAG